MPFNASSFPFKTSSLSFNASSLPFYPCQSPLAPLGPPLMPHRCPLMPPQCPLMPHCRLLKPVHLPVTLFRHMIISLWWWIINTILLELDYPVKITPKLCIMPVQFLACMLKSHLTLKFTIWLNGSPQITTIILEMDLSDRIPWKRCITLSCN